MGRSVGRRPCSGLVLTGECCEDRDDAGRPHKLLEFFCGNRLAEEKPLLFVATFPGQEGALLEVLNVLLVELA